VHAAFQMANVLYVIVKEWLTPLVDLNTTGVHKVFAQNRQFVSTTNERKGGGGTSRAEKFMWDSGLFQPGNPSS
jgi:hypothetical protein